MNAAMSTNSSSSKRNIGYKQTADQRNILLAKKTNEFTGSFKYFQEPKEVTLDLVTSSSKNTRVNKNITNNYSQNKSPGYSGAAAIQRSSSASKKDTVYFANQNKMFNRMQQDNSQNNSGILPLNNTTSSANIPKQFHTPVKRLINIQNKNQNEDINSEQKNRDKSLSECGTPSLNFKTPLKSEDTVLKQKNTNTQIGQGEQTNSSLTQFNHHHYNPNKQTLLKDMVNTSSNNNTISALGMSNGNQVQQNNYSNSIKKNHGLHQGYDSERALKPYTTQTPVKKPLINTTAIVLNGGHHGQGNHSNQPQGLAHHMAPDGDCVQQPTTQGGQHQAHSINAMNNGSCNQNDLFDTNVNIQQYRIEGELGRGAYATVKLGIDKTSSEQFALKIYQKFTLSDPNKMRNVKREISILKRLIHPNIIRMPYAFQDKNTIVLVMECLSRVSLHSFLKKKPDRRVPESEAKMIFHQLVSGVDYCHMRNIVHRDIKLENILIEESSKTIKIIDFGFSICTGVKLKIFCGTPTYMAPEIVSKVDYCGKKADIWALGIVLYVLLCGKFPFRGMSDSDLFKKIRNCVYDPPTNISDKCLNLLKRLLKFNPADRPDCYDILQDPWFYS